MPNIVVAEEQIEKLKNSLIGNKTNRRNIRINDVVQDIN